MLDEIYFHNSIRTWLSAAVICVGAFLVLRLAKALLHRVSVRRVSDSATDWADLLPALSRWVHGLFLLALGLYLGTLVLSLPGKTAEVIGRGFIAIVLFQAAVIGSHAVGFMTERYRRRKIATNAAAVTTLNSVAFLLKLMVWTVLLLAVLQNFGINVSTLVAGLGISGIAVALAVQNVLGDVFASFSIVFDKPFVIGDFIIVGEFLGAVEYIGLKTTRIRSLSGEHLVFSNKDLLQSRIRNFTRMKERRVVFTIGVVYQTDRGQLKEIPEILRKAIESQEPVRFDRAHFKEFGPYSLNFEVVYWVLNSDYTIYMNIQQAINLTIMEQFEARGIEFAYPTQTLFWSNSLNSNGQNKKLATDPHRQGQTTED